MKKSNEKIESVFLVREKELKRSTNQKDFLKLELVDNENIRYFGIFWNNPKKLYQQINFGQAVKICGHFIKTNQNRLFEIDQIEIIENFKIQDFYKKEKVDTSSLTWLNKLILNEKNSYRSILIDLFTPLVKQQLLTMPAGKLWVFNQSGGLLKRTKTLINWLEKIHLPDMDLELMQTAILLQSFAFIKGFKQNSVIEYTGEARLISLPILALVSVHHAIESSNIDLIKKDHLKHLILIQPQLNSGNLFVDPQSLEAILLV